MLGAILSRHEGTSLARREPSPPPHPLLRESLAWISLIGLVVGVIGAAAGWQAVRVPALLLFCVVGLGSAPWQFHGGLRPASRLILTALTSVSAWTLPSAAMAAVGWWHPMVVFLPLAVASCAAHALFLIRPALERRRTGAPAAPRPFVAVADAWRRWAYPAEARSTEEWVSLLLPGTLAVAGTALSLSVALAHRHIDPGYFGFAARVGPLWFVGFGLLILAFVLARGRTEWELGGIVTLLALMLVLTPAIVYDGPASQSAFKHIDLVAQIQQQGLLHSAVAVYTAWPGYFSAMAWLCDVTGIGYPLTFAVFWPPFIAVFRILALRGLAGRFLMNPFHRWLAVALVVLADSIKADYFSPQSMGYVLAFLIVAVALSTDIGGAKYAVLTAAGSALAVTHQLSPYMTVGALVILVVLRVLRPRWAPLTVLVPTVAWTLGHWSALKGQISFASLGRLSNFRPPSTAAAAGLSRSLVVTDTVLALVGGVALVSVLALVFFLMHHRSGRAWAIGLCSGVGLLLIATNPYGQEGIFRAALFGLPWLAILAAQLFRPRRTVWVRATLCATMILLAEAYVVSTTGLDNINQTRPQDVAALRYAHDQAPGRYDLLRLGPGDVPTGVRPGEFSFNLIDLGISQEDLDRLYPLAEVERITSAYADLELAARPADRKEAYALFSPVQVRYAQAYGLERAADLNALSTAFSASPYWSIAFQQDGTVLYRLDLARYVALHR